MVRRDVRALLAVVIGVFWSASLYAQDRSLTLTEIWNEQFTPAGLQSIRSLPDGGHFTVLGKNAASNAM